MTREKLTSEQAAQVLGRVRTTTALEDAALRFGCGHPMGPLALLDLIGLDSAYEILERMYAQSRDHRHAPAPLLELLDEFREPGDVPAPMLEHLVRAGYLGRKTGRGFRDHRR